MLKIRDVSVKPMSGYPRAGFEPRQPPGNSSTIGEGFGAVLLCTGLTKIQSFYGPLHSEDVTHVTFF